MKTFLLKLSIYVALAAMLHAAFAYCSGGKTDDFYLRFTSPQAPSLIIGTSRAAQGIQPDSLQTVCINNGYQTPIYNFAFTSISSPFGETYYQAILKKLDPESRNGLFIIAVEPYGIGDNSSPIPQELKEAKGQLYHAYTFNGFPNWEYLIKHYNYGWGRLVLSSANIIKSSNTLHKNGWLQVDVAVDSATAHSRALSNIADRRTDIGKFALSANRLSWLRKTIALLKEHGAVYLIRMPIGPEFYAFENELSPAFDSTLRAEADFHHIVYHDFNDMSHILRFNDGNHMQMSSAAIFSGYLAHWLQQQDK